MGAPESGTLIIRELSFPLLHFIVIKTSNDSIGWRVIPISTLEKLGEKWFSNVISLIFIQNTPQTIPPTYPQLERALSLWPLLLRFLKQYNKPKQHVSPTPPPIHGSLSFATISVYLPLLSKFLASPFHLLYINWAAISHDEMHQINKLYNSRFF